MFELDHRSHIRSSKPVRRIQGRWRKLRRGFWAE
jgi:hypothetical protein